MKIKKKPQFLKKKRRVDLKNRSKVVFSKNRGGKKVIHKNLSAEKSATFWASAMKKLGQHPIVTTVGVFVLVVAGALFYYVHNTLAVSAVKTISSQEEWEAGDYYNSTIDTKSTPGNLKIQSGSVGAWDAGTPGFSHDDTGYDYWTYDGNNYGAGMATDGTYIYQIVGGRRPYLFRFNPETNTWKQLANAPTAFYYGAAITYDAYSKSLFAIDGGDSAEATNVGNATKHLFKYDIATDTWSKIATDAPDIWTLGSVITSDGAGKIYAMRAYISAALPDAFWSYNQLTGTWNDTLPMPTQNFSSTNGQSLLFVNEPYPVGSPTSCITGCIFALGGGATANFFRYDITENQWYSTVTGMGNAGYGASLSYDSVNGNIYAHNGNAGNIFARYDVSAATWAVKVSITGGGTGSGAEATATISGGAINGFNILSGGGYYSSAPTVTILGGGGTGATATSVLTGGRVTAINVGAGGSGYTTTPAPRDTNGVVSYGGSSVYLSINGTGYIYQTRGYAVPDTWRYNISSAQWESVATPTTTFTEGNGGEDGLVVYVPTGVNQCLDASGCLFVFRGAGTATFWRYNIGAKTWTTNLTVTNLGTLSYGASSCKAGNTLYTLRGGNFLNFYSYDLTAADPGGNWTVLASMPTVHTGTGAFPANPTVVNVGYGASITCLGSTVYATKGWVSGNNYSNHFYSYSGGAWAQQTVTPQRLGLGSAIVAVPNGASCGDATGCVFALMGNQRGDWYRYNIAGTTWTQLADIPTATNYTATLTYDGAGNIYAISGDYDQKMWRYSISGDSWTRVADLPGKAGYSNGLAYDTAANIIYGLHGMATGQIWKFTPTTNDFVSASTWVSAIQDLNYVQAWEQLSATLTTGGSSNIDIALRSSPDKVSWTSWESLVTGGSGPSISQDISSATTNENRYIQLKITLNSDGTNTPNIDSVSVTYTKDSTAPTNPTATGYANSAKPLPALTNNFADGYYHTNPYFELSGSTDTSGSGVAGYYVAWTTNAALNPSSSEDYYQTGTTYRVNTDMVTASPGPTYYLRVSAKDNAGNPATPTTAFTYTYTGIASSSTTSWTANATFDQTGQPGFSSNNINLTANGNTDMTLSAVTPGTWMDLPAFSGASGTVQSFTITNGGSGYSTPPTVSFAGGGGSGAAATAVIQSGSVTGITITNAGANYTSSPTVSFAGGGGSGAAATAWIATVTTAYNDTSIVWDGNDTIYSLRSTGGQLFYKYTISTKTWTALANTGVNASTGSALVYVPADASAGCSAAAYPQGCIFATMGASTSFRRYNIQTNTWAALTQVGNSAAATVGYGGGLVYNGADYIYATRGGGNLEMYRYTISSGTWTARASVEVGFNYGASFAYVPNGTYCDDAQGCIFATQGNATNHFWRYDVSANAWNYLTAPPTASPTKNNYGATMVYNDGYLYFLTGGANSTPTNPSTDFLKYDIVNDLWTTLADVSATRGYGSTNNLVYDTTTDTIYTLREYNEPSFISYDVVNNKWRNPTIPHAQSAYGLNYGGMAFDGSDTIYVARGNQTNDFYKYTVSTQSWQRLSNIPLRMNTGSDILYVNGAVYALTGTVINSEANPRFYRYNPTTDLWTRLLDFPVSVGQGTKLVWDGSNTIYTARGAGQVTMYAYYISTVGSMTANTWNSMGNIMGGGGQAMNEGSCAVVDDSFTSLYMIQSNNTRNIYKCNINQGTGTCAWQADTLTDAPAGSGNINMYYGSACVVDGDNIFVPRGNTNNLDLLVYSITGNSWTTRALNNFYYYGRMVEGPGNILYGFRGSGGIGAAVSMDRYIQSSATVSFQRIGTWNSQILDLGSVYGFGGFTITDSLGAANTAMKYETRSCSDAACATDSNDAHWSAWSESSAKKTLGAADYYSINSPVARYVQVKATFISDRVYTPTVNDITLSYYTDGTAPNNPSVPVGGYTDNGKGTSITNNTWTNDLTPYFEWSSTDNAGGIGVDGYYVYFGMNAAGEPNTSPAACTTDVTNIACKSGTNYYSADSSGMGSWNALTQSASALTNGTYYLRIKTKDHNNNTTSSAVTAFTYLVDGSAPNDISDLSVTTYMSSNDDFTFTWSDVSDVGPSGIAQYCYHTGSSGDTCVNRATICSAGLCTLTPVSHYQSRVNTFYVKPKDAANNVGATYASTGYFYTGGPPSAPQSVTVTPGSRVDNNSFGVSWTLPSTCFGSTAGNCQASDILQYCYTINVPPSAGTCGTNTGGNPTPSIDGGWTTTSQTAARSLPAFSAASMQGTNTIYIVAKDAVGNINYANATTQTYSFTSNAPGPAEGLTVSDSSDRAANRYSLTLTWDPPTDVGSGVEAYKVYRCTTGCTNPSTVDDPPANYTSIASVNTLGYLDTSLNNTVTYSYFVRTTGTGATISGNSAVVSLKPEGKFKVAPTMSGVPSISVHIRSAEVTWLTQDDVDKNGDPVPHPASSYVQYGTTAGYGAGEPGTSDLVNDHSVSLTNLLPNTLYHYRAKWVDVDGNIGYSSDATFTTLGAPSAPTNVHVLPLSGTSNSFTFSWNAPTDEGVTIGKYYYSINSTPTADNTTELTATTVGPIAAATRQGTNTFYVVASDDSGNIDYSHYASVDFIAYTTPPGPPQNVTLVDSSNRDAKRYSLTLTWDPPVVATGFFKAQAVDANTIYYTIYRSDDGGVTFSEIATITSTGYLDTGLDSTKTYTYKVIAKDKAQATSDETVHLSAIPQGRFTTPPAITKGPEVAPDSFSAIITWTTERNASSFVDFGVASDKLTKEQGKADQESEHSIKVTGLQPKSTYFYQVKSIDIDQNEALSEILSFTTLEAPRVENVKITDVKLNDAVISWTTSKESTSMIQYGTTTKYGFTFGDAGSGYATTHTVKLENLKDGTTYHIRIEGTDRSENPIASDDYSFTTLTYPKVLVASSANKAEGQTEVKWTTNVPTTSEVEYYNENSAPKTQGNTSLVTEHSVLLFGLEDATEYKYKVSGYDQFAYLATSTQYTFKTLEDTTPPVISVVKSESNTVGSGDAAKIQIIVSWKTNEVATSQVQYGEGLSSSSFSASTDENAERVREHLVVIGGLAPAKTYHFRVVSKDKAGNDSSSQAYSVLTSQSRQSFLQIIIGNLQDTFSWLGNIGSIFGGGN